MVKLRSVKPFDLANSQHYAVKTQRFKMTEGDSIMPLTIIQFLSLFFTKMNNHNICQDLMITYITMIITVQQQEKSIQARSSSTA